MIFDVLRYPVSCPPTPEELGRIPFWIYMMWISNKKCTWSNTDFDSKLDPFWVAYWMQTNFLPDHEKEHKDIVNDINILRKMILEYEE